MLRFIPYHICFITVLFFFLILREKESTVDLLLSLFDFSLLSSAISVTLRCLMCSLSLFSPQIANKKSMSLRATQYTSSYYTVALSLIFSFSSTSMKSDSLPGKKRQMFYFTTIIISFFVVITTIMLFFFSPFLSRL